MAANYGIFCGEKQMKEVLKEKERNSELKNLSPEREKEISFDDNSPHFLIRLLHIVTLSLASMRSCTIIPL